MGKERARVEVERLRRLVTILKENPGGLWIREISRRSNLHVETVRRLLNKYSVFFEDYADFTKYNFNFKIIRLKNENVTEKAVLNYVKLKKKEAESTPLF